MKPWLFDILACPIDKHFPLSLYIFSYETKEKVFEEILQIFQIKDLNALKSENIIQISQEDGNLLIQDNLVLQKCPLKDYLELILKSVYELENVYDNSGSETSKNLLINIKNKINKKIKNFLENSKTKDLDDILPELAIVNKFKFDIEIETGIIFCPKCKRWFPIIDTIPQMLPDEYRDEKKEISFLKTNKNLLDKEFFQQDLKPFTF
jgi:uncharacterized protein YbaR (Trm112 family)